MLDMSTVKARLNASRHIPYEMIHLSTAQVQVLVHASYDNLLSNFLSFPPLKISLCLAKSLFSFSKKKNHENDTQRTLIVHYHTCVKGSTNNSRYVHITLNTGVYHVEVTHNTDPCLPETLPPSQVKTSYLFSTFILPILWLTSPEQPKLGKII